MVGKNFDFEPFIVFSEFFKFGNEQGTSSLHSISLLDENNDNIINSSDSTNFGKIFVWRDNNTDGILNTGEFTALQTDASVNLNNTSSSNQGPAGAGSTTGALPRAVARVIRAV